MKSLFWREIGSERDKKWVAAPVCRHRQAGAAAALSHVPESRNHKVMSPLVEGKEIGTGLQTLVAKDEKRAFLKILSN